jgi:hypothetical protein
MASGILDPAFAYLPCSGGVAREMRNAPPPTGHHLRFLETAQTKVRMLKIEDVENRG